MKTVQVITTGGTIEKAYSEQSGAVLNTTSKIEQYLKLLRLPDLEVHVTPLMNKDSLEMSDEDRAELVAKVGKLLRLNQPIVVTHGTDTMVESGLAIERAFPSPPFPIILTGAMSPLGFEKSDGLQNLTESLFAARVLLPGVFIVIHGQVFPVAHVRKDRERGTFVPA
jgi:L-asparaginase